MCRLVGIHLPILDQYNQIQYLKGSKSKTQAALKLKKTKMCIVPYDKKARDLKFMTKKCRDNYILENIQETAKNIYKSIDTKNIRGRINHGVMAACVMKASHENKKYIGVDKITYMFDIEFRIARSSYKKLVEMLGNNIEDKLMMDRNIRIMRGRYSIEDKIAMSEGLLDLK